MNRHNKHKDNSAKRKGNSAIIAEAAAAIELALSRPAISPEDVYKLRLMPLSRNGVYDACRRGDIECFRVGKRIVIPTAPLRRKLGLEQAT